ncbi:MAG: NADH:ubiquinone reductase (Na(+)-transporting) subunit B [Bacteroidales bacterium]|nr:NADH:ubiquinone reductase (Na(+)-transporting) subunit B [Bacteroidales bacterium]MBN2762104.1 NADH:ubiquinone reductase (Na(+)-transporting) subunit B [Bacteroidales bacterium]
MNFLRRTIDNIKPHFSKGGKFEKLSATFEAFETFLLVPGKVTQNGSHIRDSFDMKRMMALVVIAMIPALLFGMYNVGHLHFSLSSESKTFWQIFGFGFLKVFPIIVVSYVTGLAIEFTFAQIRGHEVNEGFLVTGMLIPLIVPVNISLWMVAVATAFAVIIGKEVFGGTGMNILNPALTARAFLFFAYPADMTGDKVWISGMNEAGLDTTSGATALGHLLQSVPEKTAFSDVALKLPTDIDAFLGFIPGSIGETSKLAILIGALILIYTGVGSWKIIISTFFGGLVMGWLLNAFSANAYMELPAYKHLLYGGFAFGAVFMATDPVTASQTEKGKWIYGFLTGMLAILIRVLNPAYPEGMMLAILLMNVFAPLIDYYIVEANVKRRLRRLKNESVKLNKQ